MRNDHIGSLRVMPKDPRHVTGDGDDSETTIVYKAINMVRRVKTQPNQKRWSSRAQTIAYWVIVQMVVLIVILMMRWVYFTSLAERAQ